MPDQIVTQQSAVESVEAFATQTAQVKQPDIQQTPLAESYDTCGYTPVAEGVSLFSRWSGNSRGEPILFLHGNRDNHSHFTELQSILARRWSTVAIDLRGHGFSSKVDCPLSVDLFAEDLAAFIAYHGWEKVTLIGHSLGAVTSMIYALNHPERVSRLILIGVAAYYDMPWQRPPEVTEETYQEVLKETNRRAAPYFFLDEYPEVRRRVEASWSSIVFPVHRNLIRLIRPDMRSRVGQLRMPTLVLTGEQDKSKPAGSAQWLSEHIPGSQLIVIPRTGHFMFMERPTEVAGHIQQFLELAG